MKLLKILEFLFIFSAPALAQQPVVQHLAWDYVDADLASGGVVNFTVCYDTTNCNPVLLTDPGLVKTPSATAGTSTYTFQVAALTQGSHSVSVTACNPNQCSDQSNVVTFTVTIKPNAPKNVVIK